MRWNSKEQQTIDKNFKVYVPTEYGKYRVGN